MTEPVHSFKGIKGEFQRYHLMTVIAAALTVVAILLAAITSFQVTHLGRERAQAMAVGRVDRLQHRQSAIATKRPAQMGRQLTVDKGSLPQVTSTTATLPKQSSD